MARRQTTIEEELFQQGDELGLHIKEATNLIAKENMEWEERILQLANMCFREYDAAHKENHTPALPYPLVKQVNLLRK